MKFTLHEQGLVAIGGFIGSIARYQINEWIPSLFGTFIVNFVGCVAIGFLMYESIYLGGFSRNTRLLLGVGIIGSFTTFSAFATQSVDAGLEIGTLNILANIIFGLLGVSLGRHIIVSQRGPSWNI